jgi:hypothetical protein
MPTGGNGRLGCKAEADWTGQVGSKDGGRGQAVGWGAGFHGLSFFLILGLVKWCEVFRGLGESILRAWRKPNK